MEESPKDIHSDKGHASRTTRQSSPQGADGVLGAAFQSLSGLFHDGSVKASRSMSPSDSFETSQASERGADVDMVSNIAVTPKSRNIQSGVAEQDHDLSAGTARAVASTETHVAAELSSERPNNDGPVNRLNLRKLAAAPKHAFASKSRNRGDSRTLKGSRSQEGGSRQPLPPWQWPQSAGKSAGLSTSSGPSWPSTPANSQPVGSSNPQTQASIPSSVTKDARLPAQSAGSAALTHVTSAGEAHMVDVTAKTPTTRRAIACGIITFSNQDPVRLISENTNKKGDVLGVARIAGIMAAKRCAEIIPLCHPIAITKVTVDVSVIPPNTPVPYASSPRNIYGAVVVEAQVTCSGSTGVEMEALTAVMGAALTVYDMCKAVDRRASIGDTKLLVKEGGKSGNFYARKWNQWESFRTERDAPKV